MYPKNTCNCNCCGSASMSFAYGSDQYNPSSSCRNQNSCYDASDNDCCNDGCTPCDTAPKVKGRFGLAWVSESPQCPCPEPVGWQVEFCDTPSKVEAKCEEMVRWINCPPLPRCDPCPPAELCCCAARPRCSSRKKCRCQKPQERKKFCQCQQPIFAMQASTDCRGFPMSQPADVVMRMQQCQPRPNQQQEEQKRSSMRNQQRCTCRNRQSTQSRY